MNQIRRADVKRGPMTLRRVEEIVARVTLTGPAAGWRIRVANFDGSTFEGHDMYIQIRATERCNITGALAEWGGRKFHVSHFATESEALLTIWKAVVTAMEHELRENVQIDGVTVFNPHVDVSKLIQFHRDTPLDERADPSEIFRLLDGSTP